MNLGIKSLGSRRWSGMTEPGDWNFKKTGNDEKNMPHDLFAEKLELI